MTNDIMTDVVLDHLKELRTDIKNISERVATLETNHAHNKETIFKISSIMEGISNDINRIKEIDIEQSNDLKEHMRRTALLEEEVNLLKAKFFELFSEGNTKIALGQQKNERTVKILEFLKWFVPILITILAAIFGIDFSGILEIIK